MSPMRPPLPGAKPDLTTKPTGPTPLVRPATTMLPAKPAATMLPRTEDDDLKEPKDLKKPDRMERRAAREALRNNDGMSDRPSRLDYKKPVRDQKMAKGGSVSSASKRADGIATKGKTKGKIC